MCAYEKGSTLQRGTVSPDLSVTYCSVVALVVDAAVVFGAALHCCPKEVLFSGGGGDTDWLLLAFPTTPQKGPKIKRKRGL